MPLADPEIADVVRTARTVAVVGMKDESQPHAPAFSVPAQMKRRGIRIVPINPTITSSLGVPALREVGALTERVDVVQVFRRADAVGPIADAILRMPPELQPKVVWLQSGIVNQAAAERLEAAGIGVVMDRCYAVELSIVGRGQRT